MSSRGSLALALILAGTSLAGSVAGQTTGDAKRGAAVFAAKQCAQCHRPRAEQGIGPALEEVRRPQGAYELAGRLWNHAPAMFTVLKFEAVTWPDFDAGEMADMMTYLGADAARDPAPNVAKGQMTLAMKRCLACHRLRGEGARVAPDLGDRRADVASPAAWAVKIWRHTPRAESKAREGGVLYPRFTGDEMVNLVAFLRKASEGP